MVKQSNKCITVHDIMHAV